MKNINYKIVSIVLGLVIIITYALHWQDIFNHKSADTSMKMDMQNKNIAMHQMPDGSMMMNDGSFMQSMMMDMTENMKGKTGAELEKTFLQDMIVHHQGAVDMARELLKGTKKPELIKFANDIINLQSKEIEMQKEWLKAY